MKWHDPAIEPGAVSGDRFQQISRGDPIEDAICGSFDPLFPKNAYSTEASINAPINFIAAFPSVTLRPPIALAADLSGPLAPPFATRAAAVPDVLEYATGVASRTPRPDVSLGHCVGDTEAGKRGNEFAVFPRWDER